MIAFYQNVGEIRGNVEITVIEEGGCLSPISDASSTPNAIDVLINASVIDTRKIVVDNLRRGQKSMWMISASILTYMHDVP